MYTYMYIALRHHRPLHLSSLGTTQPTLSVYIHVRVSMCALLSLWSVGADSHFTLGSRACHMQVHVRTGILAVYTVGALCVYTLGREEGVLISEVS